MSRQEVEHECKNCQALFACGGKPKYATRWHPCDCLQELAMTQEKQSGLLFFCKTMCMTDFLRIHGDKYELASLEEDSDSDPDLVEMESPNETEEDESSTQ